jgi:bifunctional non-homologous end joining protein LigD
VYSFRSGGTSFKALLIEMKANQITADKKLTSYIKPMLAELSEKPAFDDPDWLFEIKWDGYRAIAEVNKKNIKLYSRNGLSFAERYPEVTAALKTTKLNGIFDGEIVVLDHNNRSDFQYLQNYERTRKGKIHYYIFDCLELAGKNITKLPLIERKKMLQKAIPKNTVVKYSDHVVEDGTALYREAAKLNLEGIIAKKSASAYLPGKRTSAWLKLKNVQSEEAIIIGYTPPKGSRKGFGSLLLGQYHKGELVYIGNVGTGFTDRHLTELSKKLEAIRSAKPLLSIKGRPPGMISWVKPMLVCQIRYSEKTREGLIRHPVYLGLRVDKAAQEVKSEN